MGVQIDEIAPANILVINTQDFDLGFDAASSRQDKVDRILGARLESLIF